MLMIFDDRSVIMIDVYINSFSCRMGPHEEWQTVSRKTGNWLQTMARLSQGEMVTVPDGVTHDMMTSSNGNIFRVTGHLCGKFTGPRWISHTKASDAELWCSFDMRPNIRLSKQSWGWWFETPPQSLWRHRNVHQMSAGLHSYCILSVMNSSLLSE